MEGWAGTRRAFPGPFLLVIVWFFVDPGALPFQGAVRGCRWGELAQAVASLVSPSDWEEALGEQFEVTPGLISQHSWP